MNIEEINTEFQELVDRIKKCATQLTNLDLLRIQLVYTYSGQESYDTETALPINEFIATAWSKLSVYHAVSFKLLPNTYIPWTIESEVVKIKSGDYLVKMPDNKSIYIPGNKTYFYQPTSYENGNLNFELITDSSEMTKPIAVPQWNQGSMGGRVLVDYNKEHPFTQFNFPISDVYDYEGAIRSGHYFVVHTDDQSLEEIILSPEIGAEINNSVTVTLPTSIAAYYIPYQLE